MRVYVKPEIEKMEFVTEKVTSEFDIVSGGKDEVEE